MRRIFGLPASARLLIRQIAALVSSKVGQCGKCLRLSLRGALLGWGVATGAYVLGIAGPLLYLVLVWPASFTALWMLHVSAFAVRTVVLTGRMGLKRAADLVNFKTASPEDRTREPRLSRRLALRVFCEGAGLAVLVSLALQSLAQAAPNCTPWMKQYDGSWWRECVDDNGQMYCESCAPSGSPCSRVPCL